MGLWEAKEAYLNCLKAWQDRTPNILIGIMEKHKWSQEQLAARLGYTPSYISHIKTGKMKASSDMLIKLLELGGK